MSRRILKEGRRYSFSDYFNLGNPTEDIVAELGYALALERISFPHANVVRAEAIEEIRQRYYALLPKISINSETAKREFMIAPLLYEVLHNVNARLNIEYPIDVNDLLNGSVDYLLRSDHNADDRNFVVIEANKGDLEKGFTQLAVELIALDQYEENGADVLYGAITIGEVWRFGQLRRREKMIVKDIPVYRFPEDAEEIIGVLTGVLVE